MTGLKGRLREPDLKKQSQYSNGQNERKYLFERVIWKILCFRAARKQSQFKVKQTQSKPISSKFDMGLPQVSAGEWRRNDNFICGLTVPAESAKMAQQLAFGNY